MSDDAIPPSPRCGCGDVLPCVRCTSAARSGNLERLKFAHENGCPWGEYTCDAAADGGHSECLRYALENGSPFSLWKLKIRLLVGRYTCLGNGRYTDQPLPRDEPHLPATTGHHECLKYVLAIERGDHQIQTLNNNEMEAATTMATIQWGTRKARTKDSRRPREGGLACRVPQRLNTVTWSI